MALPSRDVMAAIAVTRFGLGAKPGELAAASADPASWLAAQIRTSGADQPQANPESSVERLKAMREYQMDRRDRKFEKTTAPAQPTPTAAMAGAPPTAQPPVAAAAQARDPAKIAQQMLRQETGGDFLARAQLAATTDAAFRERWALFWCNHFTVSATKLVTATVVGPFEQEAIRPYVFGSFENLLVASSSHPAMLYYLDQFQSVGPDSPFASRGGGRGRKVGLNENLAREILELHSVGVDAGYTQADVTQFARAMTGWGVGMPRDSEGQQGHFVFHEVAHEPGGVTVMGKRYNGAGVDQARSIMHDLAASPHAAHHIAVKLARHFVADDPPPSLVARLEASYMKSGGFLGQLALDLIKSPEAWDPEPRKFKTPYEYVISSYRAAGVSPQRIEGLAPLLNGMGQKAFSAPSPKGWAEDAQTWCAPDALIKRMQFAEAFSAQTVGDRDPGKLAADALGARLTAPVAKAISRAESRPEGLAIALMSPEFQRR